MWSKVINYKLKWNYYFILYAIYAVNGTVIGDKIKLTHNNGNVSVLYNDLSGYIKLINDPLIAYDE